MGKIDRPKVYDKYNEHCAYCGKIIHIRDMQVDHILPKRNGGTNNFSNLNPSCRQCNYYKKSLDLEDFRKLMKTLHKGLPNDYITALAMNYGIIELKPFNGVFYFERNEKEGNND